MNVTAEKLWLVHRAALGGVSAATGAALPVTLDEVPFPAVKAAHWGMAVVVCRFRLQGDPPLPAGMTAAEAQTILARLDEAGLLPWSPRRDVVMINDCPGGALSQKATEA